VSVSSAPLPATASTSTAAHTPSTATPAASGRTTPATSTPASTSGAATPGQGASTTRTAPGPAFLHSGGQATEQGTNSEAAAAAQVVTAHGYTPNDISTYHPHQSLRVLIGTRTGSADGYNQRAFFFLDNHYLGTDSSQPSASLRVVSQSDTEVTLAYALYRSHDPLCCPSGGQTTVHFQLNNGQLVPLNPIPPASSATGFARQ
jgi:hypothetical protein